MRRLAMGLGLACATACTDPSPEARISSVEPHTLRLGRAERAVIIGQGLRPVVRIDLDELDGPALNAGFVVSLGDTQLSEEAVVYASPTELTIDVPSTLGLGAHDVVVTTPSAQRLVLESGVEVVDDDAGAGGSGAGGSGVGGSGGEGVGGAGDVNVLLVSNGGVLQSFSSEYCPENLADPDCAPGRFEARNLHDGVHAHGIDVAAFDATWASGAFAGQPERIVFSFAGGAAAHIRRLVIQNYGEEGGLGPFYARDIVVEGEAPGGSTWFQLVAAELAPTEVPVEIDLEQLLGGAQVVGRIRLSVLSGYHPKVVENGELEAWGWLE